VSTRITPTFFGPLSIGIVLFAWLMAALAIPALPSRIPTHFGIDGSVTATGSPATLWVLPAVATLMYATLTALQLVPANRLNVPVTVTDRNRDQVYTLAHDLTRAVRLGSLLTMLGVEWASIHATGRGVIDTAFYVAIVVPMVVMFGWIASFIVRMARA